MKNTKAAGSLLVLILLLAASYTTDFRASAVRTASARQDQDSRRLPASQEFKFIYAPKDKDLIARLPAKELKLEISVASNSYEVAFKSAAQRCFDHFKGGRRVAEDEGVRIIDVCANPR